MFENLSWQMLGVLLAITGAAVAFSKILVEGVIPLEGSLPVVRFNGIKNLNTLSQAMPIIQFLCIVAMLMVIFNISVSGRMIALLLSCLLFIALHVDYEWNALNPGEDFGPKVYIKGSYPGPYIFKLIPVRYVTMAVLSLFLWFIATGDYIAWCKMFLLSIVTAFVLTIVVWTLFRNQMEKLRIILETHACESVSLYREVIGTDKVYVIVAKGGWSDGKGRELYRFIKGTISTKQRFKEGYIPRGTGFEGQPKR